MFVAPTQRLLLTLVCALALGLPTATPARAVDAEPDCAASSDTCVAIGKWNAGVGLGAGVRTNPLTTGQKIPLVVLPHISYYGKRFFLDNLDLGYTLVEDHHSSLNLVATPSYDRVFFYRSDLQNFLLNGVPTSGNFTPQDYQISGPTFDPSGSHATCPCVGISPVAGQHTNATVVLPAKHPAFAYLAGPEWSFHAGRIDGQVDVLREVTGHFNGYEVRAAVGSSLPTSHGTVGLNAGLTWKSAATVDYYYGVSGLYAPGAALNPFAKISYRLRLNHHWSLQAFVDGELLGSAIRRSPMIKQHSVESVFAGTDYDLW